MTLSKKEKSILRSIIVRSENDPKHPEFPPTHPAFPATPTYRISVPGFSNVWLKDESVNPTGTHKDRMAWEIIVVYRDFLLAKERGQTRGLLPHFSLISSGSAAYAIQFYLKQYSLPKLKVLIDIHTPLSTRTALKQIGCDVYETDLSRRSLSSREILVLTENRSGFDLTSSEAMDPTARYYDWMSYELLNESPEYCFIPFGTGNLYQNILNITKKEVRANQSDPRFTGRIATVRQCHFFGATINNPYSKAEKLYSPHLPFSHFDQQWLDLYKAAGYCGSESNVHLLQEEYLESAYHYALQLGIQCEYSGISGLAMLLQMSKKIPKGKKILIINTGKSKGT